MSRQSRTSTKVRDVKPARDAILGDQYNITTADLTRVEGLLEQIVTLLRQQQATVRVERDVSGSVIIVGGADNEVRFAPSDLSALGVLQRTEDPQRREEIYLARFVLNETYARWDRTYVPLAGILSPALRLSDRGDQGLSAAGISLKDVRQALTEYSKTRLVILGEPGAGKTTTLHRLALDLARKRLHDPVNNKLPLRADLFEFIGEHQQPSEFLKAKWETSGLQESYGDAIACEQVCFLLDGVNQMPLADRAERIERWAHWANDDLPPGNWAVFTCRTADYVTDLRLPEVRVQSLDPERMRQYFELRFGPQRAAELWRDFEKRLHSGDDRFERLARNPFMLSQLVERCVEGKPFTDSRAVLMDDLTYRLIDRELREGRQPKTLTADPRGTLNAEMEALSRLAFAMQVRGEGTGLVRTQAGQVQLGEKDQARLMLDEVINLATDATVLEAVEISRKDKAEPGYAFYHHLLQEYFAARELVRQFRAGKNLTGYWRVPWHTWQFMPRRLRPGERLEPPPVTGWEETVIMAAALAGKDAPHLIAAVWKDNLPLAGRCLAEVGTGRPELQALAEQTRAALLERQRSGKAHLRARIDAGLALGEVGHPDLVPSKFEFESRTVWVIVPPIQSVPAGEFIRGSDRADKRAFHSEYTTERRVILPAFNIGRHPVTNAEYRFFIEGNGYQNDRWWSEAGRNWRQGGPDAHTEAIEDWLEFRALVQKQNPEQLVQRLGMRPQELRLWKEATQLSDDQARERAMQQFDRPFDRPAFWDDSELNHPGKPVVGVNWYEAEAYCRWLSAVTGGKYKLPTEAEWEKATRGADGLEYPWGEEFNPSVCNTAESHIHTTTPVGLYPSGVSPYSLFDTIGNVWEWTADWYQIYPGGDSDAFDAFGERFRSVRGGSWSRYSGIARCAYRGRLLPVNFYGEVGFRVFSPD